MQSVLDQSLRRVREKRAARVKSLHLVMGEISELNHASLLEYWHRLAKGTPAEGAQLHFRLAVAEVQCMACFRKYHPANGIIHCPYCGSFGAKILSGEEFRVEEIELEYD